MVFLNYSYLGREGSGASNPNLHNVYQIGHGTSKTLQMMYHDCNYQLYEGEVLQMAVSRGQKEDIKMDQAPVPFPQLCWVYGWNT